MAQFIATFSALCDMTGAIAVEAPDAETAFRLANEAPWGTIEFEPGDTIKDSIELWELQDVNGRDVMPKANAAEAPDPWADHPTYGGEDWRQDVAAGNTRLGYADWVKSQIESEKMGGIS